MGTSFGITSSYLALGNPYAKVYTCEGSVAIAQIAHETFKELRISNIEQIHGEFFVTLDPLLKRIGQVDLVFVDGHHQREPTLRYFETLLPYCNEQTILIFDDIHWSREMEEAWELLKQHESVTLSIDLFFVGCIFLNRNLKQKQHFTIRY